ncbi:MAG TPA: hypothetical protein VFF54_08200 [Thermodesulfobacteriota bacterium]|nr:hypothetical protein [Thermodesulfobacteriota bacterium]
MKTYEYYAKLLEDGHLSIPSELKGRLKPDSTVRVLILMDEEESEWKKLATGEFLKGYSEKDSIYDSL